ncbi:MAG: pentapeptide repeat-containing protein [Bacteriovoracia bacterium]
MTFLSFLSACAVIDSNQRYRLRACSAVGGSMNPSSSYLAKETEPDPLLPPALFLCEATPGVEGSFSALNPPSPCSGVSVSFTGVTPDDFGDPGGEFGGQGCQGRGASFNGRSASEFGMEYLDLQQADLRGASFQGANLQNADLRDARVEGANFTGADLRGADLRGSTVQAEQLRDAVIDAHTRLPE